MKAEENSNFTSASPNFTDAHSLQIRLDTSRLISHVEYFLKGKTLKTEVQNNMVVESVVSTGEPLMNKVGIQMCLMWISSKVNPMTVQGYIANRQDFNILIADMYEDFTDAVYLNCVEWDMADRNLRIIVSSIMDMIELFLSRTIENWERKLFSTTTQSKSTHVAEGKGWGIPFIGGNNNGRT